MQDELKNNAMARIISLIVILIIFLSYLILSQSRISWTVDEQRWITAGQNVMRSGWTGSPDEISHPVLFFMSQAGIREFFSDGSRDSEILWARAGIYPYLMIGMAVVFYESLKLSGFAGAFISCLFLVFSPTFMAHAHLATNDGMLASAVFCYLAAFNRLAESRSYKNSMFLILAQTFGLLTKFSFFLVPVTAGMYWLMIMKKRQFWNDVFVFFILPGLSSLILLNLAYGFEGSFKPMQNINLSRSILHTISQTSIGKFPAGLPEKYLLGMDMHLGFSGNWKAFFFGTISDKGFAGYDIIAFLTKTTIPALMLIGSALISIRTLRLTQMESLSLFTGVVWLLYFGFIHKIDCGVRYVLPVYPLLFFVSGRVVQWNAGFRFKGIHWAGCLLLFQILTSMLQYPFFISYFNLLSGGSSNGYKILSDSNLAWMEETKALSEYQTKHQIKQFIFGLEKRYGLLDPYLEYRPISKDEKYFPSTGDFVVNITSLQSYLHADPNAFLWSRLLIPDAVIANASYIYHLKIDPEKRIDTMRKALQDNLHHGFRYPWAEKFLRENGFTLHYPHDLRQEDLTAGNAILNTSRLPSFSVIEIESITDCREIQIIGTTEENKLLTAVLVGQNGESALFRFPEEKNFVKIMLKTSGKFPSSFRVATIYYLTDTSI